MLHKQNRANPAEINLVKEQGKLISGPLFGLLVYDLDDQRPSRFAFIVSTKLDKRATRRNQAKRGLRLAINSLLWQIKKGKLVLFLAKKNLLEQSQEIIQQELEKMLIKANIIEK